MTQTRLVHLTSVHPAFDTRIFHKECVSLFEAGYDVTLIVPHESDQVVKGVSVRHIARPTSRARRMFGTTFRVLFAAIAENADIYHFHDPELIPVGILLKAIGKRVIYDVHEDVPMQTLGKYWIPRLLRRPIASLMAIFEAVAARVFDGIVTATPTISKRFPPGKTITIHNYPIATPTAVQTAPQSERGRYIVYVGAISRDRGLFAMLEALAKTDARLLLGGKFSEPRLAEQARHSPGWNQVDYRGVLSRAEVNSLLNESRLGIVTLLPIPSYVPSLPVKLFEYMLAGLPVVASDFPLWRRIIDDAKCGLLVDPQNPDAIAQACQWLLDHPIEAQAMGNRGRAAVLQKYCWSSEARRLVNFYRRLDSGLSVDSATPNVITKAA